MDLKKYTIKDIDELKNFDGFISQDGIFLKVRKRGDLYDCHEIFAQIYSKIIYNLNPIIEYNKIKSKKDLPNNNCYKDCFINMFGYIDYSYKNNKLEINIPNPKINGYNINDNQIKFVLKLARVNNDKVNYKNFFIYDDTNDYELFKVKKL